MANGCILTDAGAEGLGGPASLDLAPYFFGSCTQVLPGGRRATDTTNGHQASPTAGNANAA